MNRTRILRVGIAVVALSLLLVLANTFGANASGISALLSAGYDIARWTVDGGGGSSTGGNYAINGTIGQPDAGTLQGSSYSLQGGFWGGGAPSTHVFLPLVAR
jgi:hypothetical protein